MYQHQYGTDISLGTRPTPKAGPSSVGTRSTARTSHQQQQDQIREYLFEKFGGLKNFYESSFSKVLVEKGGFNLYTLLLAIFCFYTIFVHDTLVGSFKIINPHRMHCRIIESMDNMQVTNLSCEILNTRLYYHHNSPSKVRALQDLSFLPAITVKKCNTNRSSAKPMIINSDRRDVQFICEKISYKNCVDILYIASEVLFALPFGVMGDIYGRRVVFVLSATLNVLGNALVFVNSVWVAYIAQVINGMASENMILSSYIIFSEHCNKNMRRLGILVFVGRGVSVLFLYVILAEVRQWRIDHAAFYSLFYGIVFIMWYLEESPRWQFYTGRTGAAWEAVGEPPPSEPAINMRIYKPTLKEHFSLFIKPYFKSRILLTFALFFLSTTIHFTTFVIMHELTLGALQYYFIIGICKIITTILTLILFIFTTRKTSLFIFYGLITLVNLALFVQSAETTSELFFVTVLIIHKCLSPGAIVILLYQTLEQYPTKHRYTAVAVAVIAIKISTLLTSFTQEYLRPRQQSVTYTPLLMFSITVVLLVCFLHETSKSDLPDVEREALSTKFALV